MTERLLAVALLLIVARLMYWKRPTPPDDFKVTLVYVGKEAPLEVVNLPMVG